MPFGTEPVEEGIALALSGGGFRTTLFHLGSLWRLHELGYLPKLDRVSSVSGGSITAGVLELQWKDLNFANKVATNFNEVIVSPLRDFCGKNIDAPAIGEGALPPWKSVSDAIQEEYDKHLFKREENTRGAGVLKGCEGPVFCARLKHDEWLCSGLRRRGKQL